MYCSLKRFKRLKYLNCLDFFFSKVYHSFDKVILASAVIVRKLIESDKLSNLADNYRFDALVHSPRKNVDKLHRWIEDGDYEWDLSSKQSVLGKNICNSIIHSYVYSLYTNEKAYIDGFFVSSDFDRNKLLYQISLASWIEFLNYIASDDVIEVSLHFDGKKMEYVSKGKSRPHIGRHL